MIISGIGLIVIAVGTAVIGAIDGEDNRIFVCTIAIAIGIMFCGYGLPHNHELTKTLAREVDLQQISVKGENKFHAEIEITYKDGEFDSVVLIPKTTVKK